MKFKITKITTGRMPCSRCFWALALMLAFIFRSEAQTFYWTPTAMPNFKNTGTNYITLPAGSRLSGSVAYGAGGPQGGGWMIVLIGFENNQPNAQGTAPVGPNTWVGGTPLPIYQSTSPAGGTASWRDLAVPPGPGTFDLWFEAYSVTTDDTDICIYDVENDPPSVWVGLVTGILGTVSVEAPPAPVITRVRISDTTLILTLTNGVVGQTYVALATTNLALPLSGWTPIATNTFTGGTLNYTNAVNPTAPRQFYALRTP